MHFSQRSGRRPVSRISTTSRPRTATRLRLLYYAEAGDGIDWHFDGNIYLGQRWAGIFPLFEETGDDTTKLELEVNGEVMTLDLKRYNTLLLFKETR